MEKGFTCKCNSTLWRGLLSVLLIAVLTATLFVGAAPASAAAATKSEPVVFADKIVNGVIPTYIDGDKIDLGPILNPITRDGGGMQYVSSKYLRDKTIGNIFDWTASTSVTKSKGFNISSILTATVYGITMSINFSWKSDISYTWTKDKGYRQFKVVGVGDIRIDKYYNLRTNSYHYVKTTINQEDIKKQR